MEKRKIDFKTLDGIIDTTKRNDPISIATIQLLGLFSELERNFIVMRTQEGKLAKGKSAIGGRPRKLSGDILEQFKKDVLAKKSLPKLSQKYAISISTAARQRKRILDDLR